MSKSFLNLNASGKKCCQSKNMKGRSASSSGGVTTIQQFINNVQNAAPVIPIDPTDPNLPSDATFVNLTVTNNLTSLLNLIANNITGSNLNIDGGSLVLDNNSISSSGDIILNPNNFIDPVTGEETGSVRIENNLTVQGTFTRMCVNHITMRDPVPIIGFCDDPNIPDSIEISDNNNDLGFQFVYARSITPPTPTRFDGFFGYDKDRGRFVFWENSLINPGIFGTDQNYYRNPSSLTPNKLDTEFIYTYLITTADDPNSPSVLNGVYQKNDISIEALTGEIFTRSNDQTHDISNNLNYNVLDTEIHTIGNNILDPGRFIVRDVNNPSCNVIDLDSKTINKRLLLSNENKIEITTECGTSSSDINITSAGDTNITSLNETNISSTSGINVINQENDLLIQSGSNSLNRNGHMHIVSESSSESANIYTWIPAGRTIIASSNGIILDGGLNSADFVKIKPKLQVDMIEGCPPNTVVEFDSNICVNSSFKIETNTINQKSSNIIIENTLPSSASGNIVLRTSNGNINFIANGLNKTITVNPGITFTNTEISNPSTSSPARTIYYNTSPSEDRFRIDEDPILVLPNSQIVNVSSNAIAIFQNGANSEEHKIIPTNVEIINSNDLCVPGILEVDTINEKTSSITIETTTNGDINLIANGSNKTITINPGMTFVNTETLNPSTFSSERTIYYNTSSSEDRFRIDEDPILVLPNSEITNVSSNSIAIFQNGANSEEHKIIPTNVEIINSNDLCIPGKLEVDTINEKTNNITIRTTTNGNINLIANGSNRTIIMDPGITFINTETVNPSTSSSERTIYYNTLSSEDRFRIDEDPILVLPNSEITNVSSNSIAIFQNGANSEEHKIIPTNVEIINSNDLCVPGILQVDIINEKTSGIIIETTTNGNIELIANGPNRTILMDPGVTFVNTESVNPSTSSPERTIYYNTLSSEDRFRIDEDPILVLPNSEITNVSTNAIAIFQNGTNSEEHKIIPTNVEIINSNNLCIPGILEVDTINEKTSNITIRTTANGNINLISNGPNRTVTIDPGVTFINTETVNPSTSSPDRTIYYNTLSSEGRFRIDEDPILVLPNSEITNVSSNSIAIFQNGTNSEEHKIIPTNIEIVNSNDLCIPGILQVDTINEKTINGNISITNVGTGSIIFNPSTEVCVNGKLKAIDATNEVSSDRLIFGTTIYQINTPAPVSPGGVLYYDGSNIIGVTDVASSGEVLTYDGVNVIWDSVSSTFHDTYENGTTTSDQTICLDTLFGGGIIIKDSDIFLSPLTQGDLFSVDDSSGDNYFEIIKNGYCDVSINLGSQNTPVNVKIYGKSTPDKEAFCAVNDSGENTFRVIPNPVDPNKEVMIDGGMIVSEPVCTNGLLLFTEPTIPIVLKECEGILWIEETSPCPGELKWTDSNGTYNVLQNLQNMYDYSGDKTLIITELNFSDGSDVIFSLKGSPSGGDKIVNVNGDLNVTGVIDPTALVLTGQGLHPVNVTGTEACIWSSEILPNSCELKFTNSESTFNIIQNLQEVYDCSKEKCVNINGEYSINYEDKEIFKIICEDKDETILIDCDLMVSGVMGTTATLYSNLKSKPIELEDDDTSFIWSTNSFLKFTNMEGTYNLVQNLQDIYEISENKAICLDDNLGITFLDSELNELFSIFKNPNGNDKNINVNGSLSVTGEINLKKIESDGIVLKSQLVPPIFDSATSAAIWCSDNISGKNVLVSNEYGTLSLLQDIQDVYDRSSKSLEMDEDGLTFTSLKTQYEILKMTDDNVKFNSNVNVNGVILSLGNIFKKTSNNSIDLSEHGGDVSLWYDGNLKITNSESTINVVQNLQEVYNLSNNIVVSENGLTISNESSGMTNYLLRVKNEVDYLSVSKTEIKTDCENVNLTSENGKVNINNKRIITTRQPHVPDASINLSKKITINSDSQLPEPSVSVDILDSNNLQNLETLKIIVSHNEQISNLKDEVDELKLTINMLLNTLRVHGLIDNL